MRTRRPRVASTPAPASTSTADPRAAAAAKVVSRVPTSSYSLRRLLQRLCHDPEVPLAAVADLERAVGPTRRDVQTWHAAIKAVGHDAVLRSLVALATHAETGPLTALFIRDSYARALRRRACRTAEAEAAEAVATTEARARQAWLESVFEGSQEQRAPDIG